MFFNDAVNHGLPLLTIVNNGHSGQTTTYWLSTALAADQALNPDLYFVNYGYNDVSTELTPHRPSPTYARDSHRFARRKW